MNHLVVLSITVNHLTTLKFLWFLFIIISIHVCEIVIIVFSCRILSDAVE